MVSLEIAARSPGTRPKNKPEAMTESVCYSDETSFGNFSSQIMPSNRGHLGLATLVSSIDHQAVGVAAQLEARACVVGFGTTVDWASSCAVNCMTSLHWPKL